MEGIVEAIVAFIVIFAPFWLWMELRGPTQPTSPATATAPPPRTPHRRAAPKSLQARARLFDLEYDGGRKRKSIQISLRGTIKVPRNGYQVKWGLRLLDVTGSKPELIASLHPAFTDGERPWLVWTSESFSTIPYREYDISDWMELQPIPLEIVYPPYSGSRKIEALVTATGRDGVIAVSVAASLQVTFSQPGYVEERQQGRKDEEELEEATIELAMAVCAADGEIDKRERALVRNFCTRKVELHPAPKREEVKKRLNNVLRRSASSTRLEKNVKNIEFLCSRVAKVASERQKLSIMELCVNIASADDEVHRSEARMLEAIREGFDIPLGTYRDLCGRHIGPAVETASAVLASLLGIRKGMSKKEVLDILMKETTKWLEMQGSKDASRRQKAEQMLTELAEIKRRFRD